jgi:hypothetical protein
MSTTVEFSRDELARLRLTDAELARELFLAGERVADDDDERDSALDYVFALIQEALERWAPHAEAAETARNIRENESPQLMKTALESHRAGVAERAAARAEIHGAYRSLGIEGGAGA